MALTFSNFKREIPASVLTRGREYYQLGQVVDLEEGGEDNWLAVVEGTRSYQVSIKRLPDKSLETYCPCPYDYGEHCKHIAATLYAIEEAFPELLEGKRRKSTSKRTTRQDRLRQALESASRQQLVDILLKIAIGDREFQSFLLMELGTTDKSGDVRVLLKEALRPPRGSHGFLDYWTATDAGVKVSGIVARADNIRETDPDGAVMIYQVVMEETIDALGHADDSTGVLSGNAYRAAEGLADCVQFLSPSSRTALFDYCLKSGVSEKFQGWDFGWDLLSLAADLVETEEDREKLYASLALVGKDDPIPSPFLFLGNFAETQIATIKLTVINRLDGEEEALRFIHANKHLTLFRGMLIEHYINEDDLETALALIEDGQEEVHRTGGASYGIDSQYRRYILEIAQKRGETQTVIDQARALWLGRAGQEFFHILKQTVPPTEWPDYREKLVADKVCPPELAAWACAEEGMWSQLRDIVLARPYLLPPYQLEIEKRFPDESSIAYTAIARKMLQDVSNRDTYRTAASFLIRMQKLGHGEEGKAVARQLIDQYPQRRAMIDELKRVL